MQLTVIERLVALGLLPAEGNIVKMRLRLKLIEKLGLTSEEISEYDLKPGDVEGTVQWRQDLPQEKEIDLKGPEIAAISENLEKLDKDEKLTPQHLSLYDKFVV